MYCISHLNIKTRDVEKGDQDTIQKPTTSTPNQVLPKKRFVIVFIGFFLSVLMAALDQTIVSTAVPAIVSDLGSLTEISWVFVAYLLTSTAFMPLYG